MNTKQYLNTLYSAYKLCRTYYVLPLVAATVAGYFSSVSSEVLWVDIILASLALLLAGMAAWSENEIVDATVDSYGKTKYKWGLYVSGGTNLISNNKVPVKFAVIQTVLLTVLSLILSFLVNPLFFMFTVSILLIGFAYSVKPIRLKERGVWGLVFVSFAYGVLAYSAGWVASGALLNETSILFGTFISLSFFGFEGLAYLTDYKQDKDSGEKTIAVSLGYMATKYILATSQIAAVVFIVFFAKVSAGVSLVSLDMMFSILLIIFSMIFAACTIKASSQSSLSTLRVLGVPMVVSVSFLIV